MSFRDFDVFQRGDLVKLLGDVGEAEVEGLREILVVTSFLQRADGRVLLLKRSEKVGSFQGQWAAVSGFLEESDPAAQAVREIREETGLGTEDLRLGTRGRSVRARSGDRLFVVHPFRFRVENPEIRLDWEHTDFDWVDPLEIRTRSAVPKLAQVWAEVAPNPSLPPQG